MKFIFYLDIIESFHKTSPFSQVAVFTITVCIVTCFLWELSSVWLERMTVNHDVGGSNPSVSVSLHLQQRLVSGRLK